ncbi:MAG: septation protein A [Gammaproteobacteria bacterium]
MKFLFDLFPIALFFVAYKLYGIYAATATIIVATFVQVGLVWLRHRRFENMHLITLGIVVIFGGLTLALHNPLFIKWKPTVAYWLFAGAFLVSGFIGEKTLVQRMLAHAISVPGPIWSRLNLAWVAFFIAMGILNIYVAYQFDENTWVNFKLFGLMGLTLAFMLAQGFYLARYVEPEEEPDGES